MKIVATIEGDKLCIRASGAALEFPASETLRVAKILNELRAALQPLVKRIEAETRLVVDAAIQVEMLRSDKGVATRIEPNAALVIGLTLIKSALRCWWARFAFNNFRSRTDG